MKNQKMTGKPSGASSRKPSSSSSSAHRKTRWESSSNPPPSDQNPNSSPKRSSKPSPVPSKPAVDPVGRPILPTPPTTVSGAPFPPPDSFPSPPPTYGFHMLERRTIVLADGSVRSYFALPLDYSDDFRPPPARHLDLPPGEKLFPYGQEQGLGFDRRDREREELYGRGGAGSHDYWSSSGLEGGRAPAEKRKYGDDERRDGRDGRDDFARQRQQLLQYGNPNPNGYPSGSGDRSDYMGPTGTSSPFRRENLDSGRGGIHDMRPAKHMKVGGENYKDTKHSNVDRQAVKRAFLRYSKTVNENSAQKKNYLEDGKHGAMQCLACGRASKDYADVHGLIMHCYNSSNPELSADHLGLHKALCVLMGWNYAKAPENSKAYWSLSADEAAANREDLIIWPPVVVIHNTNSGRRKDGRMEGMGNKDMDYKLKELGFGGGKSKSIYGKDGHMGITVVRFANTQSGLKEAERLAEHFDKENHGRKDWARVQAMQSGGNDENNPYLVKPDEKTGEKKRIFYGYLGTASDLEVVDFDMRKKAVIKSRMEFDPSE